MTYFQEALSAKPPRNNLIAWLWQKLAHGRKLPARGNTAKTDPSPRKQFPKSGMPKTNEVVTNLSIRAGFTAGPQ